MPATPRLLLPLLALAALAALPACDQAREVRTRAADTGVTRCTACHGDPARAGTELERAAPPTGAGGGTAATDPDVGAHQAHLAGRAFSAGVACHECHLAPGPRHPSGAVTLAFDVAGNLARATVYGPASRTCATSYCHDPLGKGLTTPAWNAGGEVGCGSCHALPPAVADGHPGVTGGLASCAGCHPETMNADGSVKAAGGKHVNGAVEATGHGDYSAAAVHGPKALDFIAGAPGSLDCKGCHGADYGGASAPSCNACHAAAGWTGWQQNCSFCHGATTPAARAGYAVADHPAWAAPPDAVAQRLDPAHAAAPARTGAHQGHLAAGAFTGAFTCATCHAVPADLSHVGGAEARATVALSGAGQRHLSAALGTYDQASGTCATACHGAGGSPAWSSAAPMACGGCHALPPAPASGHPAVSSDLATCAGCHPTTMKADGTLDLAGGRHLDGTVDVTSHGNYASRTVHGPKALDFMGGVSGALDCKACHGADWGGGYGPSCNACHDALGWVGWRTNCSFCHGARAGMEGYALADHPGWAAPPDAVAQRLGGGASPARTGAHQSHLAAGAFTGAFTCATCHAVPADLGHVGGSTARATVALSGAGQRSLPAALGTYDQGAGTCATACHNGPSPAWASTTPMACGGCHAVPPGPSTGHPTVPGGLPDCALCHPETVKPDGSLDLPGGKHLDGAVQVARHGDLSAPALHGPQFFDFLRGASGALNCAGCHGADYGGGMASSCNACHVASGWTGWTTNCSFCHGATTAAAKAGYAFADHPGWSAPPDALSQRLGGGAAPARTGAHQIHLTGSALSGPFRCATCHAVPSTLAHAAGPGRAPVALSGAGQRSLPASLGSYDQAAGTCATACHGGTAVSWTGGPLGCAGCHGAPPATGMHDLHVNDLGFGCRLCHAATIDPTAGAGGIGPLLSPPTNHVNGLAEVLFPVAVTTTVRDPITGGCASDCHDSSESRPW